MATVHDEMGRTIRTVANEVGTEIVSVGSDNAGRVSTPVTSAGSAVSKDPDDDVHSLCHARP